MHVFNFIELVQAIVFMLTQLFCAKGKLEQKLTVYIKVNFHQTNVNVPGGVSVTEIAANSEKCKLNYGNLTQSNYKNMTKLQAFQELKFFI